ncbi:MAG: tRNA (guanosine(46)-N7)-methyltransferase TrmB [Clostridia bacterium]|nr:tRNA (guanosine(46)-N7)-methyltransferase TrmB [Clostridia bacterium]
MRIRNNPNAKVELLNCDKFLETRKDLQRILDQNKDKKIYIEIGMGKGEFISQMAHDNPNDIFIGIELSVSVLALAVKKILRYELAHNIHLKNLYLMSFDASKIMEYFEVHQVEKIYLNFSDPWPKKKHIKRRLTHENFLKEYKRVLKEKGIIEFKTDNRLLFEYSLVSMQNFGMKFLEVYLDLHSTDIPNVVTEYETKFSSKGPIYKLVAQI